MSRRELKVLKEENYNLISRKWKGPFGSIAEWDPEWELNLNTNQPLFMPKMWKLLRKENSMNSIMSLEKKVHNKVSIAKLSP